MEIRGLLPADVPSLAAGFRRPSRSDGLVGFSRSHAARGNEKRLARGIRCRVMVRSNLAA